MTESDARRVISHLFGMGWCIRAVRFFEHVGSVGRWYAEFEKPYPPAGPAVYVDASIAEHILALLPAVTAPDDEHTAPHALSDEVLMKILGDESGAVAKTFMCRIRLDGQKIYTQPRPRASKPNEADDAAWLDRMLAAPLPRDPDAHAVDCRCATCCALRGRRLNATGSGA